MSEHEADGRVAFVRLSEVQEVPIGGWTAEHDQGWTRPLVNKELNGSPDLFMSAFRMGPNQYHPGHRHLNVGEIYYVLEGSAEMRVGDRVETVSAGTAIYTPRGVAHSTRTHDVGVTMLVIFPEGDWSRVQKEFTE